MCPQLTFFGVELPGAAGAVLTGVADLGMGIILVSFKGAQALRSAYMETVHKWGLEQCVHSHPHALQCLHLCRSPNPQLRS